MASNDVIDSLKVEPYAEAVSIDPSKLRTAIHQSETVREAARVTAETQSLESALRLEWVTKCWLSGELG